MALVKDFTNGHKPRVHTDEECYIIQDDKASYHEASEHELESLEVCQWCADDVEFSVPEAPRVCDQLRQMDPDDLLEGVR